MKALLSVLALSLLAVPALADIDTVCTGGGPRGNAQTIVIKHVLSDIGSKSDLVRWNGQVTESFLMASNASTVSFSLTGNRRVYSIDYNFMDATARLTGQGLNVQLYCSRRNY